VTVTKVGPFVVATSIAANVRAMLDASAAAGFVLGGSGYRDSARQIELRIAHCGPTDYDIWEKPSSQCSPPTARPGRSMHERGLALDITCSGSLITSRSSPCFFWLAVYASDFGLYNLPSEPWHWSTTGT
jgi:LAS superfamily LD-carboxypeptidase LdcB